jgi:hypothetical protein
MRKLRNRGEAGSEDLGHSLLVFVAAQNQHRLVVLVEPLIEVFGT